MSETMMSETMRTPRNVSLYQLLGTKHLIAKIVLFLCKQKENEIFASAPLKPENRWRQESEVLTAESEVLTTDGDKKVRS